MQRLHNNTRAFILSLIDLFYPLFKRFMPLQTFRYAACGGFNTSIDISLFFISYNYIFKKESIVFSHFALSPHIAAFLVGFMFSFPSGFYLSRYVVFQETSVKKSEQLIKYFSVVFICLMLNYGFLKLFVDSFGWYPTPSKILTTVFVVAFSYVAQKNFTFTPESKKKGKGSI